MAIKKVVNHTINSSDLDTWRIEFQARHNLRVNFGIMNSAITNVTPIAGSVPPQSTVEVTHFIKDMDQAWPHIGLSGVLLSSADPKSSLRGSRGAI